MNKYIVSAMVAIVLVIAIYWAQTKPQRHLEQRPDVANAAGKIEYQNESFNPRGGRVAAEFSGGRPVGYLRCAQAAPRAVEGRIRNYREFQ